MSLVAVQSVQVRTLNGSGVVLDLKVRVRNETSASVRITSLELRVALAGPWIAQGSAAVPVDLAGSAESDLMVRLEVPWDRVARPDLGAILCGEIPYQVDGTASIDRPMRLTGIKVQAAGRYDAPGPIPVRFRAGVAPLELISLRGAKLTEIGIMHQTGSVELLLVNPLAFDLPISHLGYRIESCGVPVATGSMNGLVIKPGLNPLQIPVSMSALDGGIGVLGSLLRGGLPSLGARGDMTLGAPGCERILSWEVGSQ